MKNHLFLYCTFVSETFENLNLMVKINQLQMKTAHHKLAFILCVCVCMHVWNWKTIFLW